MPARARQSLVAGEKGYGERFREHDKRRVVGRKVLAQGPHPVRHDAHQTLATGGGDQAAVLADHDRLAVRRLPEQQLVVVGKGGPPVHRVREVGSRR